MPRISCLAACASLCLTISCGDDYLLRIDADEPGVDRVAVWYEQQDVASFVAAEVQVRATEPALPSSKHSPGSYTWTSSRPSVAEVIQPGRVQMKDTGYARITVSSGRATSWIDVNVLPRIASVRLTPDSSAIAVGEIAMILMEALDGFGETIDVEKLTKLMTVRAVNTAAGVIQLRPPAGYNLWAATGTGPGVASLRLEVDIFRGSRLVDSAKVVVR